MPPWHGTSSIFRLLHEQGSPWLKSKVLFADHQAIVLNKPQNLVSQLYRPGTGGTQAKVRFLAQLVRVCHRSLTIILAIIGTEIVL